MAIVRVTLVETVTTKYTTDVIYPDDPFTRKIIIEGEKNNAPEYLYQTVMKYGIPDREILFNREYTFEDVAAETISEVVRDAIAVERALADQAKERDDAGS